MSVTLTDDEILQFKNNGISEDDIQHTVNSYRSGGLTDSDIRSKVDVKLQEFQNPKVLEGGVSYNDILDNNSLSQDEKVSMINQVGENERQQYDKEYRDEVRPQQIGAGVKMLSPIAGLIPVAGVPLAGALYGVGQGIEDEDNIKGILGKGALYGGSTMVGGAVGGQLTGKLPVLKNKLADLALKQAVNGGSIGGFDGMAEGIKENINKGQFDPLEIAKYGLGGLTFGSAISAAPSLLIKNAGNKVKYSEIESKKQLIRDAIMARRAMTDESIYQSTNDLNAFIKQTKELSKEFGISDKNLRELMPFLRENTSLPKSLNRNDLRSAWNKLTIEQKGKVKSLADNTSAMFEKYWDEYSTTRGGIRKADELTYISHLWDLNKQQKAKLQNYFKSSSKFEMKRFIDSYAKGIDGIQMPDGEILKLKPKTLDYAEILKTHAHEVINATNNSKFSNWLRKQKLSDNSYILDSPAKGYKKLNHPALPENTHIHKDFKSVVNPVFENPGAKTLFGKAYDTVNNFAKTCKFLLNGMHGIALTETAAAHEGFIPFKTFKTLTNLPKIIDGIKNNNYDLFKKSTLAKKAIKDGVQFGSLTDLDIEQFSTGLDNVINLVDKISFGASKIITKPLRGLVDVNNKVLWNYLHNTYKLDAYDTLINRVQKQNKNPLSKEVRQEIGQIVNDTFGGQNWDTLGIKPGAVQNARRVLLSPDWNLSAFIRQSLGTLSSELGQKILNHFAHKNKFGSEARELARKAGIASMTNDIEAAGIRGDVTRKFFMRFIVQSVVYSNLVNFTCREYDKSKHPEYYENGEQGKSSFENNRMNENDSTLTKLTDTAFPRPFVGRDEKGREKYARISKQAREVPEFVEDGTTSAIRKTASKTSPLISPVATKLADNVTDGWNEASIGERYKETFKPFSVSSEGFSPFYSTTKGVNYYKLREYFDTSLESGDTNNFEKVFKQAKMNNIDAEKILLQSGRESMVNAVANQDTKEVERIWNILEEFNIDADKAYKYAIYRHIESQEN